VLVEVAEIVGARLEVNFVGRPGEVADRELVFRETLVEERFEVAVTALVVELQVPDERDAGLGRDFEWQGGGDRLGLAGTGRGLEIDVVAGEFRVLLRRRLA